MPVLNLTSFLSFALLLVLSLTTSFLPDQGQVTFVNAAAAGPTLLKTAKPKQTQTPKVFPTLTFTPVPSQFDLILGRPTTNSISASVYAKSAMQVFLVYGKIPGNYTFQTTPVSLKASVPQTIELTGLSPDTQYYYALITNGVLSGEHTFRTQRAAGNPFIFTIDADPHNREPNFNGELYATTLANILNDNPDFHIDLGDTFMTEKVGAKTLAAATSTFTDMRPYFGIIGSDAPLFLVNGNHEGELGWLLSGTNKNLPLWSTQLRQLYYPIPTPGNFYSGSTAVDKITGAARDGYYSWIWGDALFIVLDPYWYTTVKPQPASLNNNWNWTLGKNQYDWLKQTLTASTAKFKLVFVHNLVGGNNTDGRGGIEAAPFFEWGGKNADGTYGFDLKRPGWGTRAAIHQLLVENHVSAVFHGHDHVFVKQDLDGIVYQEVPQPSNTQYNNTRLAADYGYLSGVVRSSSGHLRVSVTPSQVTVEYVRSYLAKDENTTQHNGQVDYSYVISSP